MYLLEEEDANCIPFERSLHDVLAARDILLQFFPLELVYIILDLAHYWVHMKSVRAQHTDVAADFSATNNVSLCYLLTSPMLQGCTHEGETIRLRIASVKFTTFSHDQGWCSDESLRGTYAGYSWFEAAILRSSQAPNTVPWIALAEDVPVGLDERFFYDPKLEVRGEGAAHDQRRWAVQRNLCADREFREHVINWNAGAVASVSDKGAGDGEGFVGQLRSGDRISVIVRAVFPGWSNVVERVEVSVSYRLV
ncbi:hypothetical protein DFH06DRAFT_1079894 [Mycena polygramma]|nr:hypothetical protein DFH06DRAFT_1079894 [Mycena polygramma]